MPVLIASGGLDRKVNVWDAGGHITRSLAFPESQVNCLTYSPHRSLLAAGGHGCIRLFTGSGAPQSNQKTKSATAPEKPTKSDGLQKGVLGATDPSMLANAGNVVHMVFIPLSSKHDSVSVDKATGLGPSWASTLQSWDNTAALLASQNAEARPTTSQDAAEGTTITQVEGTSAGSGEVLASSFFTSCAPKVGNKPGAQPQVVVSEDIVTFGSADPQATPEEGSKHTVWLDVALVAAFEDGSVKVFALKGTTSAAFVAPQSEVGKELSAPLLYFVGRKATANGDTSPSIGAMYHRLESVSFTLVRDVPTHVPITAAHCLPSRQLLLTGSQLGRLLVWSMPALLGFFDREPGSNPVAPVVASGFTFGVDASAVFDSKEGAPPEALTSKSPIVQELALEGDASTIRSIAAAHVMNYVVVATDGGKVHAFGFLQGRRSHILGSLWAHTRTHTTNVSRLEAWERQRVQAASTNHYSWIPLTGGCGDERMVLRSLQRPVRNSNPKYPQTHNPYALEQFSVFAAHQQYILCVAVSPNGRYITTSSADSSVCIWRVPEPLALGQFLWFRDLSAPPIPVPIDLAPKRGSDVGDVESNGGSSATVPTPAVTVGQQCVSAVAELLSKVGRDEGERVLSIVAAVASGVRGHYIFGGGVGSGLVEDSSLLGSWALARVLVGHSRWVWNCGVSPCSTYILSVSSDHSGRLWQLPPTLATPTTYISSSASSAANRVYSKEAIVDALQGALAPDPGDPQAVQRSISALLKTTLLLPNGAGAPVEDLSFEYCWGVGQEVPKAVEVPVTTLQFVEHAAAEAVLEQQSLFFLTPKSADDVTLRLPPTAAPTTQTATVASFVGHSRPVTCCLLDIYQ